MITPRKLASASLATIALTTAALAAGPPDIVWQTAGHTGSVAAVAYSPDGSFVASGGGYYMDGTVKLWDAADGTLLDTLPGHNTSLLSVDISAGGTHAASGYVVGTYPPGGVCDLWDLQSGSVLGVFGGCFVAFSADGTLLASGGGGVARNIIVHDVATLEQIASIYTGSYVSDVAISPDNQIAAAANNDHNVRLYDLATGTLLHTLVGHTDSVATVAFSPDRQWIASGAGGFDNPNDASIKIWDVNTGQLVRTLEGHENWTHDVEFSPDGQSLLSCGRDGTSPSTYNTVKLWDVADGTLLAVYDQQVEQGVPDVSFSPNGARFAYARGSGMVTVARLSCPGDLDGDNDVDLSDLAVLLANYPTQNGALPDEGDLDGDGDVDLSDLASLLAAYALPC